MSIVIFMFCFVAYMSTKIFLFSKVFKSNLSLWTSILYGRLSVVDSSLSPKDTKIQLPLLYTIQFNFLCYTHT